MVGFYINRAYNQEVMKLIDYLSQAEAKGQAIGHFNVSNLEMLKAVWLAASELSLPVIVGVSEGERDFIGIKQIADLVKGLRQEHNYPIFLNADHTYSLNRIKEVVAAGYDSVIFDGSNLPIEENIKITKQVVDYVKDNNPDILVEGELGYIGASSKILDELPTDVDLSPTALPTDQDAREYVLATGVDLLSPAVGNIHGMLKNSVNPHLVIEKISSIRQAVDIPLVLHGGSGISDDDFIKAIKAGISQIHISTEMRIAYRDALRKSLQDNPDELAPYRLLKPTVAEVYKVVKRRLELFANLI